MRASEVTLSVHPPTPLAAQKDQITTARVLTIFAVLAVLTLALRLPYAGYLFTDDGLRFTVAEELLRGKALYREVYLDKPPMTALVYALMFWLFGAHIIVMRLFMIVESLVISAVLYKYGSWLYGKRAGLIAAGLFTFSSTTSVNSHVQGLNTDFLMLLPYTIGSYFLARAYFERRARFGLIGGATAGLAFMTNPKGFADLLFFGLLFIIPTRLLTGDASAQLTSETDEMNGERARLSAVGIMLLVIIGFVSCLIPFLLYLASTKSLSAYWLYQWRWEAAYAGYLPFWEFIPRGIWYTGKYLLRNNTLMFALVFIAAVTLRAFKFERSRQSSPANARMYRSDVTMLVWFAASLAAIAVGGRFYSNYFAQFLPSLCLMAGRALLSTSEILKQKRSVVRWSTVGLLAVGFIATVVVFHTRTVALAARSLSGMRSDLTEDWYHERLNREERDVAMLVCELDNEDNTPTLLSGEALRAGGPRFRPPQAPTDYLFIWGARAEIYYWSGLLPASRYTTSQPLTGVPADFHHSDSAERSILTDSITAAARAQLILDLEQTRPKYIVDELGYFNTSLSILSFPDMKDFMKGYKSLGATGRFLIYKRKVSHKRRGKAAVTE